MSTTLNRPLSTERKAFLHGLFTTALEGGIGYWSVCRTYHWSSWDLDTKESVPDLDGFKAVIEPPYDMFTNEQLGWGIWAETESGDTPEDRVALTIDLEVMDRGARLLCLWVQGLVDDKGRPVPLDEGEPCHDDSYLWQYVEAYVSNGQRGDYDAGVADMAVQFGLFSEVVYG